MGLIKKQGSHTTIKRGKHAGVDGTITGSALSLGLSGKKKVRTSDGKVIKVKTKNLTRDLGR